jgi:O-antigen ligase
MTWNQRTTAVKDGLALVIALAAMVWSIRHIDSSSRMILIPVALLCPLVSCGLALFILVLGYLVPQAVLGGPSIAALVYLMLGVMVVNLLYNRFIHRTRSEYAVPTSVLACFGGLVLIILTSSLFSFEDNEFNLDRWLALPFFVLALGQFRNKTDRGMFLLALILSSAYLSYWAITQATAMDIKKFNRGIGLTDPNYLACWIDLGLIVVVASLLHLYVTGNKWRFALTVPAGGFAALVIYGLSIGASRGISVALLFTFVVLFLLTAWRSRILLGVFVALLGLAPLLWNLPLFDNFRRRLDEGGTGDRLELTQDALNHWVNSPVWNMMMGNGSGSTFRILRLHSHNVYTEMLLDYGVVGLLIFVILLGLAWWSAFRQEGAFRLIAIGWLAFLCIAGMSVIPFYYIWAWLILAAIFTIPARALNSQPKAAGQ